MDAMCKRNFKKFIFEEVVPRVAMCGGKNGPMESVDDSRCAVPDAMADRTT